MKLLNFSEWIRINESCTNNEDFKTQNVKYLSQGYNNIEEFVKDWGFRIVYKTDIGKYLEENTSFTIRVTRDAQYQSALKSLSMFS